MSGKLCDGLTTNQGVRSHESRAYCQGRAFATGGGSLTAQSGTTGAEGSNTGITWTAQQYGVGVRVNLIDPGAASQALAVSVVGKEVNVSLETDGGGALASTAAEVYTAVNADGDAGALVQGADTGASTGAGTAPEESVTLSGGTVDYLMGSDAALSFEEGFDSYNGGVGTVLAQDCCADPAYDGV